MKTIIMDAYMGTLLLIITSALCMGAALAAWNG